MRQRLGKFSSNSKDILVAVESHQGLLIYALLETGYLVYPINPKAMERYRDRYRMSSSKSDPKDAMVLANILRTDLPGSSTGQDSASVTHASRSDRTAYP